MNEGSANSGRTGRLHRRLLLAGVLVLTGLLVQLATLFWNHPVAFMAFLAAGVPLTGVGVLLYLYTLVSSKEEVS